MTHISPPGKKNNRSSLLSLENNYRHANGGAKTLTIKRLNSVYNSRVKQIWLKFYLIAFFVAEWAVDASFCHFMLQWRRSTSQSNNFETDISIDKSVTTIL